MTVRNPGGQPPKQKNKTAGASDQINWSRARLSGKDLLMMMAWRVRAEPMQEFHDNTQSGVVLPRQDHVVVLGFRRVALVGSYLHLLWIEEHFSLVAFLELEYDYEVVVRYCVQGDTSVGHTRKPP
jgi:hypothetical protein